MEIERRALYNLMRMNWLRNPTMSAEPWQVEDYRELTQEMLFERLQAHDLHLNKDYFYSLSNEVDTPEELTAILLEDVEPAPTPRVYDQVYLLFFELWRRYITDRPCLSIFCDELDHQINRYDVEKLDDDEAVQDIISNLQTILDENTDKGGDPHDVFKLIAGNCAQDLEAFLYDYISEQLDSDNDTYANEMLEGFTPYIEDAKWFDFLRMRAVLQTQKSDPHRILKELIDRYDSDHDLEFNLELLGFMVKAGNRELFFNLVKKTIPLIAIEADFQDLLDICADFYHFLDMEAQEKAVRRLASKRVKIPIENLFHLKDPATSELLAII